MYENVTYIYCNRPRRKHVSYSKIALMGIGAAVVVIILAAFVWVYVSTMVHMFRYAESGMQKLTYDVQLSHDIAHADIAHERAYKLSDINVVLAAPTDEETNMLDVPTNYTSNSGFKTYMDYRTLTSRSSTQYALQQDATTDLDTGIRMYDGFYMIALGTYYAQSAGERFHITLTSGVEFDAITGDIKADVHTDELHQHCNGNIVEFIVDTNVISNKCRTMGDMSYAGFDGQILSIEKLSLEGG